MTIADLALALPRHLCASISVALLTWFGPNLATAGECGDRPCITIGTYNIKLLGNGGPANSPNELNRLAERIARDADFDVVVLVEINIGSREWTDRLLPALEARGYELTGAGAFGGDDPSRQQHVVLLHRTAKVEVIGAAADLDTETSYDDGKGCAYDSLRPVTTARFRAIGSRFDFRVYGVHLKSNRKVGGLPKCDDEIRTLQIADLANAVERYQIDEAEGDHIIAGDFNMPFRSPEFSKLRSLGYETQIDAPCSKTQLWACSYVIKRYAGIIDHVIVSDKMAELVPDSGRILSVGNLGSYIGSQSDHVPVSAQFYLDLPDDD